MTDVKTLTGESIREDFLSWSGGVPPESRDEISVYMDSSCPVTADVAEVERFLIEWMDGENNKPFGQWIAETRPRIGVV